MAHTTYKIYELVDNAVNHNWSVPEFQRNFVWKTTQARDLAESLWLNYPVGSLLLWDSRRPVQPKLVSDALSPNLWLVDGQQRTTALCILFGRKPYWWKHDWDDIRRKYDIRFDIQAKEPPYFLVANAVIRKSKVDRYIPLWQLLILDTTKDEDRKTQEALAERIKSQGLCDGESVLSVYSRLDKVRKIRDMEIVAVTIDHELEDVVEVFSRLNSTGTRVTEADIYLGVVAARNPGWVRSTFLEYLSDLKNSGFDVDPNLLFRSMTGIGAKKARFREIDDDFWNDARIQPAWKRTTIAWKRLVKNFQEYGILSNDPLPTEAALVTIVSLMDKFPSNSFQYALYWFLQASRYGRYSGSGTTSLEEDLRDTAEADSIKSAIQKLMLRFPQNDPLDAEDFLRDYSDSRFGRFFLYLLVYRNKARDWNKEGHRLGFEGQDLLADFRPQWHHIFPKKFLSKYKVPEDKINALANIGVIGPDTNIRISDTEPMKYIGSPKYDITPKKLAQQFIDGDIVETPVEQYELWLNKRAQRLADAGNEFLNELKGDLL